VSSLENLARTAYEAHRDAHPASLPPWEELGDIDQQAWRAAVSAVAAQTGTTLAEPVAPGRTLVLQTGDEEHIFHQDFTAGRQGALIVDDEFASGQHVRFMIAHGLWFIEDMGSTNGTWLNKRRFHGPQRIKKGDRIRIGHTTVTVLTA